MLTMSICVEKPLLWHAGFLTPSTFFFNSLFSLHPFPGAVQIPLCVYTAAVQYGPFLICSIKHIVYKKSVCLLGVFPGK